MIRSTFALAPLLLCSCALAQTSPAQFIASRQGEVNRMAEIFYNTHLNQATWTQHELAECASFTHHAFVRFDGTATTASFLAIYDLTHPPARSLNQPWQGGVTFVRVPSHQENRQDSGPSPDYLIVALNRVLKQERPTGTQPQTLASIQATAACFISITGNVPQKNSPESNSALSSNEPLPLPVSGTLIPLNSGATFTRSQYIDLDQNGLIIDAGVSVTPK